MIRSVDGGLHRSYDSTADKAGYIRICCGEVPGLAWGTRIEPPQADCLVGDIGLRCGKDSPVLSMAPSDPVDKKTEQSA